MQFEFTLPEIQLIVNILATRPYQEVAPLVANINVQYAAAEAAKTITATPATPTS
jgi:hypothetical protein